MTEMTKKVKSRTWEQLPEVYKNTVFVIICVIGEGSTYMHSFISIKASLRIIDSQSTGTFCKSVLSIEMLIRIDRSHLS